MRHDVADEQYPPREVHLGDKPVLAYDMHPGPMPWSHNGTALLKKAQRGILILDTYVPDDAKNAAAIIAAQVGRLAGREEMLPRFTKETMRLPVSLPVF
jgi:hypothetical protein